MRNRESNPTRTNGGRSRSASSRAERHARGGIRKRSSMTLTWTLLLGVAVLLAACGAQPAAQTPAAGAATTANEDTDNAVRSITHLKGTTEIPAQPQRVVALSAAYIDHLLTIGEKPVGVNNEERYGGDYVPYLADQLEGVATVGSAEAPNLEAILQLKPDVILVESRTGESTYEQLVKIAPTIVLGNEWKEYDEDPDFWTEDLLKIAEMYDKTELAKTRIAELDAQTSAVKALVEQSDHRKLAYIRVREKMLQIYAQNGHPTNTLLYRELGFEPTSITPLDQREDLSLEGVADLDADRLILEVDPNGVDFLQAAQQSSIWKSVPVVQQKQVYETDSFWLFKGWGVLGRTEIVEDVRKLVEVE